MQYGTSLNKMAHRVVRDVAFIKAFFTFVMSYGFTVLAQKLSRCVLGQALRAPGG
jgi:hypothetical protein